VVHHSLCELCYLITCEYNPCFLYGTAPPPPFYAMRLRRLPCTRDPDLNLIGIMERTPASRAALPVPSRLLHSTESQDLFLSRSCPTNAMDNPYRPLDASTSSLVGSNRSIHTLGTSPPNTEEQSLPKRSRLGNRVVSSPISPRRKAKSTSRTRPGTMFTPFNRPSSKREWSVFEQRMKNEGQMRTKNTLRESVSESAFPSPFQQTSDLATRSESPVAGAPSLRRVAVEDGHESDGASTVGYDSESDSEDSSRSSIPTSSPPPQKQRWYLKWKPPSLTTLQRNILKCAVAYFVGSLFTFNLTLSSLITSVISAGVENAPSKSGHMVATV